TPLERELAQRFGESSLRTGAAADPYLHDSTEMQGLAGRADAVLAPAGAAEVEEAVAWCYERGIAIVPRGGGTGFSGGAVPMGGGVVLSLERLDRVRHLDPECWRMEVESGVTTGRIHQVARENGLYYPVDPGASEQSQIGGNLACNAGGPHSFKYGVTRAFVLGLEAVVAPGRTVRFGGPLRKDVAGYDIPGLLVGSEGTLGVIVSAWLRLVPAPELQIPVAGVYPTAAAGAAALRRVVGYGLQPATLEYLDGACVAATRASFPVELPEPAGFLVLAEADGTAAAANALTAELEEALGEDATLVRTFATPAEQRALWRWRSGVSFAVAARRGGKMSEDIAVPFDQLEAAIEVVAELAGETGLPTCSWGHAGDGNLHATFMIDAHEPADVRRASAGAELLFQRTLALGGTVSGEHGLGWVKRGQLARQFGPAELDLQRALKTLFDPKNLLNPGKKVEPAPSPVG
ncbi:MAG: FAD-linked oxidase C-terminal domain-containing protein, partial [Candidatus Dormiibacterota bacterium]